KFGITQETESAAGWGEPCLVDPRPHPSLGRVPGAIESHARFEALGTLVIADHTRACQALADMFVLGAEYLLPRPTGQTSYQLWVTEALFDFGEHLSLALWRFHSPRAQCVAQILGSGVGKDGSCRARDRQRADDDLIHARVEQNVLLLHPRQCGGCRDVE